MILIQLVSLQVDLLISYYIVMNVSSSTYNLLIQIRSFKANKRSRSESMGYTPPKIKTKRTF